MKKRALLPCAFAALALLQSHNASSAVISVGSFPELNPSPAITIPADTFLVPIEISGANNLQFWQFDLLFDNTVVEVVDPPDGSSGIYAAEFTPGDPDTLSFILGGFPLNFLGLVDDVAGSYPSFLDGPSGDGVLAYILFRFLEGQETNDPNLRVGDTTVQHRVPEPGTLVLLAGGMLLIGWRRLIALLYSKPSRRNGTWLRGKPG